MAEDYGSDMGGMDNPGMGGEAAAALKTPDKTVAGATITCGPETFPEGKKLNPGDIVEFKVVGPASDGGYELAYNYGEGETPKGEEQQGETWEQGLRKEMSPRSGGDEGEGY